MKKVASLIIFALTAAAAPAQEPEPPYAWSATMPLGVHLPATIDTTQINYAQRFVPSMVTDAYATTGNYGAEGRDMIWLNRPATTDFYFWDPLRAWLPGGLGGADSFTFYNTRIPMTLLSYNFGGGSDAGQDRLHGIFSGNATKEIQIGAYVDYLYSKGAYDKQAVKDFNYGFSGSYMGERWKLQLWLLHCNMVNKENGGITDDRYITDPAAVQGGQNSINAKQIPVNLNDAHTRMKGYDLFVNNRYSLGYHRYERADTDTVERKIFVPVTDLIHTLRLQSSQHIFHDQPTTSDTQGFWPATYYNEGYTHDLTDWLMVSNTLGVTLNEGFRSWVKAGLTAFVTYDYCRVKLPAYDTMEGRELTPLPQALPADSYAYNRLYVGGRFSSRLNRYVNWDVTGRIGLVGVPGTFDVKGRLQGMVPLWGDTLKLTAYADLANRSPSPLMEHYRSNHFVWDNSFSDMQQLRFGGLLEFPKTGTSINIGTETVTNCIYFGPDALPRQHNPGVQLFWARLDQRLKAGVLHWDNTVTYQATTDENVIPLPALAIRSNLYLLVRIAKVLHLQLGVDCDYYTRYRAPGYQPATMAFYNQHDALVGNYPFMNLYANMRLKRAVFYLMMSHINQGMTGDNYFSMLHYPLNPRRLQLGVSINFAD